MRVTSFSPLKRETSQEKYPLDSAIIPYLEFIGIRCFLGIF